MVEGYVVRQLADMSGHSPSTIRRIIDYWLVRPPSSESDLSGHPYLIFDGTGFEHRKGLYAVMSAQGSLLLHGVGDVSEGYRDLFPFCQTLRERNLTPRSATVDGNPQIIRVLLALWPNLTIQRCLVHVQRQGLRWCRRHPKRTEAKHLQSLFRRVTEIETFAQRDQFIVQVREWEARFGHRLAPSEGSGRVFSDLKAARRMLLRALPDLFHYLDDPGIPRSTNALEGYFGRLKHRYRQHHGLIKDRRENFLKWYLHLCRW